MNKIMKIAYLGFLKIRWGGKINGLFLLLNAYIDDYKKKKKSIIHTYLIHRKGFTVDDWTVSTVNRNNYKKYISSVQYYKMHPINGTFSSWIDDKLTLKYLCHGTTLDEYMPEYYFYIDEVGNVAKLADCPNSLPNNEIISVLHLKKRLAVKRIAGSFGEGFYCISTKNNKYYVNDTELTLDELDNFFDSLRQYIITEHFFPHESFCKLSNGAVNCFRYLVGRLNGKMIPIERYIRFGTKKSRFVENYAAGGVLCFVNNKGEFFEGNILIDGENHIIKTHPDNGEKLEGKLPLWDEVAEALQKIDKAFPNLKYLGIDFVFTNENKVKILEINSLTSLDALQMKKSLLESEAKDFFVQLLN